MLNSEEETIETSPTLVVVGEGDRGNRGSRTSLLSLLHRAVVGQRFPLVLKLLVTSGNNSQCECLSHMQPTLACYIPPIDVLHGFLFFLSLPNDFRFVIHIISLDRNGL